MSLAKWTLMVVISCCLMGCTIKQGFFLTSSKYVYPNSNVEPLGHVDATNSWTTLLFPQRIGAEEINDILKEALTQKKADLLINYKMTVSVTRFPLGIFYTELTVDGTAAKMTIGRQELK